MNKNSNNDVPIVLKFLELKSKVFQEIPYDFFLIKDAECTLILKLLVQE